MKVGGNRENSAKSMVAVVLPLVDCTVTAKTLFVFGAFEDGCNVRETGVQDVCDPLTLTDLEASTFPVAVCNATVNLPLKEDAEGNL